MAAVDPPWRALKAVPFRRSEPELDLLALVEKLDNGKPIREARTSGQAAQRINWRHD